MMPRIALEAAWHPDRRQALLLAAGPLLGALPGCQLLPRKPVTPMPLLRLPRSAAGPAETLVVLLPGAYSLPQEFVDAGYVSALRQQGTPADVVIADAHLGYFNDRSVLRRLREDVVAPARAQGYGRVWLVGISLGGFGALAYASVHGRGLADGVDGVLAVAPYLGSQDLLAQMQATGGPRAWADAIGPGGARPPGGDGSPDAGAQALWRWLIDPPAAAPPVYLAYGREDRLVAGHRMMAGLLPAGRVSTVPGGHDWPPWLALWQQWLRLGLLDAPLAGGAKPPAAAAG